MTAIRLAEVWFRHHSLAASVLPIVDGASLSFVATLLAVHSHRFILLQKPYPSKLALWHWSVRETKFFLYGIAVWLIGSLFYMTSVLAGWFIGEVLGGISKNVSMAVILSGIACGILICLYVGVRLMFIFPSLAIDEETTKDRMDDSWQRTKAVRWPLIFIMSLTSLPLFIGVTHVSESLVSHADQLSVGAATPFLLIASAAVLLVILFQATLISFAFRATENPR